MSKLKENLKNSWGFILVCMAIIMANVNHLSYYREFSNLIEDIGVAIFFAVISEFLMRRIFQYYLEKMILKDVLAFLFIGLFSGLLVFITNGDITFKNILGVVFGEFFLGAVYYKTHSLSYVIFLGFLSNFADLVSTIVALPDITELDLLSDKFLTIYFLVATLYIAKGDLLPKNWKLKWIDILYVLLSITTPIIYFLAG